jgi:AcrR family transcriptional regulator
MARPAVHAVPITPSSERREQLLDAAERAVRRHGPDVTMEDFAAEAGITKPILYRHFGSKGGLYRALAERFTTHLLHENSRLLRGTADPRRRIVRTFDLYLSWVEENPEYYRFLARHATFEQPEAHAVIAEYVRRLAAEVADVMRPDLARAGIDGRAAEAWAYGLIGYVQLATDRWLEHPTMSKRQFVEALVSLVWDGFTGLARSARGDRG